MKGGQAQGPLVKSVHIPLLSEGIQANPGLLGQKGGLITKSSLKRGFYSDYFFFFLYYESNSPYISFFIPADVLLSLQLFE